MAAVAADTVGNCDLLVELTSLPTLSTAAPASCWKLAMFVMFLRSDDAGREFENRPDRAGEERDGAGGADGAGAGAGADDGMWFSSCCTVWDSSCSIPGS